MAEPKATVYLVDDDPSVRKALTRLLAVLGYRVQSFESAEDFIRRWQREEGPACLVLDVRMPGLTGLDLQQELQNNGAILPVIFITGHGDIPMSVKAMKAGAVDFLPKPIQEQSLVRAVEQALARASQDQQRNGELQDIRRRWDSLTPREREVLELVVSGLLNKQIAYQLGTVEKTIKVHRARVIEKMEVGSLAELVRSAAVIGLPKKSSR